MTSFVQPFDWLLYRCCIVVMFVFYLRYQCSLFPCQYKYEALMHIFFQPLYFFILSGATLSVRIFDRSYGPCVFAFKSCMDSNITRWCSSCFSHDMFVVLEILGNAQKFQMIQTKLEEIPPWRLWWLCASFKFLHLRKIDTFTLGMKCLRTDPTNLMMSPFGFEGPRRIHTMGFFLCSEPDYMAQSSFLQSLSGFP